MPSTENAGNATAGTFTNINQVEHLQHCSVPGVGHTAAFRSIDLDAEATGIGHGDGIPLFDNYQPLPTVIIGMNQAICQCFPECLMHRGIITLVPPSILNGTLIS